MIATNDNHNRSADINNFLKQHQWDDVMRTPIVGDCSFRSYERLKKITGEQCILMDAPPPENVQPFISVSQLFEEAELSSPHILAKDEKNGFLLLEDLKNDSFTKKLAENNRLELELYKHAIEACCLLQQHQGKHTLVPYSEKKLIEELQLFTDWYLPHLNSQLTDVQKTSFVSLWKEQLFPLLDHTTQVIVHRDYHADNLFWLPERTNAQQVGIIDYQDAVIGHPAYDVVSLLEDARRDVSPTTVKEVLEHYISLSPNIDHNQFMQDYAIIGAQRNLKITGIFARMDKRSNKPEYLNYLPRVLDHIAHDLSHPTLSPLVEWLKKHTPSTLIDTLKI